MQVIKLVELNSVEVEDRIKQELEDNPALEDAENEPRSESEALYDGEDDLNENEREPISEEDIILGDYFSEDDVPDYRLNTPTSRKNEPSFIEIGHFDEKSLSESLMEQVGLLKLDERKQLIAEYIIGSLDENGYLERELQAISNDLLFQRQLEVSPLQLEDVLYEIQDLDPAGVGARDLQECLLLQLHRLKSSPPVEHAIKMVTDYFEEFSRKHYDKIMRQMNIGKTNYVKPSRRWLPSTPSQAARWVERYKPL